MHYKVRRGIRKPVTERLEVKKSPIRFETTIVGSKEIDGKRVMLTSEPKVFELPQESLATETSDEKP